MIEQKPIDWRDYFEGPFTFDDEGTFIFGTGNKKSGPQIMAEVVELRGWGYLTGMRNGLSENDGIEVQKQIQAVICAALNAEWEKGREL